MNSNERNKQVVRNLFEIGVNQARLGLLDGFFSPEYVGPTGDKGPEGFKAVMNSLMTAFPDIHYAIESVIAEDDQVAIRWCWTGTHRARFRDHAATNKAVSNTGVAIFSLKNGRIVGSKLETDRLGFLEQIGAVTLSPAPAPR